MAEGRAKGAHLRSERRANAETGTTASNRRLDLLAFSLIAFVIVLIWLPTFTTPRTMPLNDDFLLHVARHEAVRKSLVEYRTLPLRSHWFGGGYPTLGEPEDPALNPLVLLSLLFGSAMGVQLLAFVAALAGGLGTYALARYVLDYTRWGALFSALIVGASRCVLENMAAGNIGELCASYLPVCLLLIGLSCRRRHVALFLLPLVFYTMLSTGKQGFFMAILYIAVLCLLDAPRVLRSLAPEGGARKLEGRALKILILALGVAFLVGMARILPLLEFIRAVGGLTESTLDTYPTRSGGSTVYPLGTGGSAGYITFGWIPFALFGIALCCFWKRSLPWVISLALSIWLALGENAPLNLFGLLQDLPVFSAIAIPNKFFWFQILISIAVGSGQFFWLLRRLRRRWVEHLCAALLIIAAMSFLYPRAMSLQRNISRVEAPAEPFIQQEEFFNVRGSGIPRNRVGPPRALTYLNMLENVGTIDWYTAVPLAENAIPKYFVGEEDTPIPNPEYRGEVFFVDSAGLSPATGLGPPAPPGSVQSWSFAPNSIVADVIVDRPGVLVINQNYHPAWSTDRGELFERAGLLAVRLREIGSYTIQLHYRPRSFVVGLIITILSLTAWALACWASATGRLHLGALRRRETNEPEAGA